MKHRTIATAVLLGALLLAVACSGGDGDSVVEPPPRALSSPEATVAAARPVPVDPAPPPPSRGPAVVLDPGHGGDEVGAANHGVVEKESNLEMALRIEAILQAQGVRVVLTRREDARVAVAPSSDAPDAFPATRFDLQARVDIANAEVADLFVSIHSNGSTDASQSGVEVWYDPNRAFGAQNERLAESVVANVLRELGAYGYAALDRGIKDDTCFRSRFGRCFPLFLLGPERTTRREDLVARGLNPDAFGFPPGQDAVTSRATGMPGVLAELLFISNEADAAMLRDDGARDAMARGIAAAVMEMLAEPAG